MLTKKQKGINWVLTAILLVLSLFFLFPVVWMLANSFKPDAAITADMNTVAAFIPPAPGGGFFENYITILTNTNFQHPLLCSNLDCMRGGGERAGRLCLGKDPFSLPGTVGAFDPAVADRTHGDNPYHPFPDDCQGRPPQYGSGIYPSHDSEPI